MKNDNSVDIIANRTEKFNNVNMIMKIIAKTRVTLGSKVVDATLGNGNDILFLMKLVGEEGYGYGFDIQKDAIEVSVNKLIEANMNTNVVLICDGHENMDLHIKEKVDFVVFNLGYYPKGDHSIITKPKTTIAAINKSMQLLSSHGIICVSSYINHDGGYNEYIKISEFLKTIDQREFNVVESKFINQKNGPAVLFTIEKRV